eukprot:CAMPEP_0174282274 /NCGR_PEP_ID=MMETSP0809-20121228/2748_1 /TAXON_ID=73025 ORGANISM="Eutreptiella gymnastica-like, Strain CCMP1594" /NCGR_SAMPLE_ID=MMETSP0809 /ASSEMBLY_ACC=CAM_ASM_000658 /LENGTH=76 /DNA_ID=CAMNT_0015376353 /DNA_START=139 /DNA_END=369 /DNA_ORIENTATION=-
MRALRGGRVVRRGRRTPAARCAVEGPCRRALYRRSGAAVFHALPCCSAAVQNGVGARGGGCVFVMESPGPQSIREK